MSDTYVTVQGWIGTDVVLRKVNGHSVVDLRIASTARFKRSGEWVDGDTTWYTAPFWRQQADNILRSVHKGDPVIVHGRLRTEEFTRQNGEPGSKLVIDQAVVGHDLYWGVSQFARTPRPDQTDADRAGAPHAESHADPGPTGDWGGVAERAVPVGEQSGSDAA